MSSQPIDIHTLFKLLLYVQGNAQTPVGKAVIETIKLYVEDLDGGTPLVVRPNLSAEKQAIELATRLMKQATAGNVIQDAIQSLPEAQKIIAPHKKKSFDA
jgi:formaldehyde-activating enzyme involved in methanogenesis